MNVEQWKIAIKNAVTDVQREGKHDRLNLLARALAEAVQAKQELRNKGYGCTGLSLLETVRNEVPNR